MVVCFDVPMLFVLDSYEEGSWIGVVCSGMSRNRGTFVAFTSVSQNVLYMVSMGVPLFFLNFSIFRGKFTIL